MKAKIILFLALVSIALCKVCKDLDKDCVAYTALKYCKQGQYITWMKQNCKAACGLCDSGGGVGSVCKDIHKDCGAYADLKYCTEGKYVPWMKLNCKATCGLCGGDSGDANGCLRAHNMYRRRHINTPDMQWDSALARGAEKWAQHLASIRSLKMSNGPYGENVYMSWGGKRTGICKNAAKSWYDAIKFYDFDKPAWSTKTVTFTQVVWKSSTKLGVGIAQKGKNIAVVARYLPAGNMMGGFTQNVLRLKKT